MLYSRDPYFVKPFKGKGGRQLFLLQDFINFPPHVNFSNQNTKIRDLLSNCLRCHIAKTQSYTKKICGKGSSNGSSQKAIDYVAEIISSEECTHYF